MVKPFNFDAKNSDNSFCFAPSVFLGNLKKLADCNEHVVRIETACSDCYMPRANSEAMVVCKVCYHEFHFCCYLCSIKVENQGFSNLKADFLCHNCLSIQQKTHYLDPKLIDRVSQELYSLPCHKLTSNLSIVLSCNKYFKNFVDEASQYEKLLEMNNKYGISLSVVGIGSMYNSLYNVMENNKKDLPFDVSLTDLTRTQTFYLLVLLICSIQGVKKLMSPCLLNVK